MRLHPLLLLVVLAACEHTGPASAADPGPEGPFIPGEPLRLTYGSGTGERTPQWSRTPTEIIYAFSHDQNQFDMNRWCVGALPAAGGSRGRAYCDTDAAARDTTSILTSWPAEAPDGRVVFEHRRFRRFANFPFRSELVLRGSSQGANVRILPLPFFANDKSQAAVTHPAWLDAERIIFVGRGVVATTNDSVSTGQDIFEFTVADSVPGISVVPGTTWASSLDLDPSGDTLYYTISGDSMVYRRVLSSGTVDTIFNFGALGIARDVRVRNGRLVAIVGGDVTWGVHPSLLMAQKDVGGPIFFATLPAGAPVMVTPDYARYQHLALSPDGEYVVGAHLGDLWRVSLP